MGSALQFAGFVVILSLVVGVASMGVASDTPAAATANPADMEVTLSDDENHTETVRVPDVGEQASVTAFLTVTLRTSNENDTLGAASVSIVNQNRSAVVYADEFESTYGPGDSRQYQAIDPDASGGDVFAFRFNNTLGENVEWRLSYGLTAEAR